MLDVWGAALSTRSPTMLAATSCLVDQKGMASVLQGQMVCRNHYCGLCGHIAHDDGDSKETPFDLRIIAWFVSIDSNSSVPS